MISAGFSAALLMLASVPAAAVDWSKVAGKDIVLFYPAQLSWELLLTQAEHSGADKFLREGKDCRQCHEGEETASGKLLVADKTFERAPIAGKPGSIKATVKTAHDGANLHVQLSFAPGTQPDAAMEPEFATKVSLMLDDGAVIEATRGGCWGACHDDMARMPSGGDGDTTKYLARSRVKMARTGGPEKKPADVLEKLRSEGGFLEYWQARLKPGAAPTVADGWILAARTEHPTPIVTASATEADGVTTVTLTRPLTAPPGYKQIAPGKTYTLGFAIHAGHTSRRFHYVSLEKTLALDAGKADFIAKRQ
jgi:cytochrome c-type protein NapC